MRGGGVAMAAVPEGVFVPWARTALAVILITLSALADGMAYPRWRNIQRALRDQAPLLRPPSRPCSATGANASGAAARSTRTGGKRTNNSSYSAQ
ncbi:hypothetical protein ACWGH8_34580 [Nonomuraea muscovyensis]|uniref:Uncharacterized membrane protein YidH (DUF202 family) n=1 Tax=Nonomuraea muscovyensis TaxID=1124761 RepID=A0A7X0EUE4_9ACTN|nr:hypothetical protein [Nonomuraea muscovyensis]MBB6344343.1 uncharacterized membrane protein YidH (DUF202 family) [Nonomuraea muscovyensis]